jgi:RpiR family carbohydrate utilization transcriptional regulator
MTSIENLLAYYDTLESGSTMHSILRNCLQNLPRIGNMTIYQLADLCFTSPATISRLVKSLGYRSYPTFQQSISDCVGRYYYHNRFVPALSTEQGPQYNMKQFIAQSERTLQEAGKLIDSEILERIAAEIHASSFCGIFPYGFIFCEMNLQSDIFLSGIPCDITIGDSAQVHAAQQLPEHSFSLFLAPDCIDGYSSVERVVQEARKRNSRICIVSSTPGAPFLPLADIPVSFSGCQHAADAFFMEYFIALLVIQYRNMYFSGQ